MKTITSVRAFMALSLLFSTSAYSQVTRAYNQNSARSNNAKALSVYFSPVYTTPTAKSGDSLLFRGTGAGVKFGADYFFNAIGLGVVSGFSSVNADDALINDFLKRNTIPQDQLVIAKSAQQSMYLLVGPSLRWGKNVQVYAHAKGGLFINNGGLVNIQQKGASRSIYRNEATTKSIYPGFQTGLGIQYSNKSDTWSFGFGADYMNTKTQVQNYDLRRAGAIEGLKLNRTISDLMAGISIRYNIRSPRDAASGQATGRRTRDAASGLPTGRRSAMTTRDAANGLPTGRRSVMTTRDAASGLPTGRRSAETVTEVMITEEVEIPEPGANCGPVTQRVTNPDGTVQEMTFACPDDAAAYLQKTNGSMPNRISMNVTVPKQTQGATFGEKVNQGLQAAGGALAQGKNIISGNISWATEGSTGIVTNKSVSNLSGGGSGAAAASYAATGMVVNNPGPGIGSVLTLYSRDAGSGQASGKREKGSGMATGRRQYEPFFREGAGNGCDSCAETAKLSSIKNNPLYSGNNHAGNNPLYNGSKKDPPDQDCGGLDGVDVFLKDPRTGAVIARTTSGVCGEFFFANVPDGDYVVAVIAAYLSRKGYQYYMAKSDMNRKGYDYYASKSDLMGTVEAGHSALQVRLDMIPGDTDLDPSAAAALIKTKTKSNQSNDRMAAPGNEEEIWSPRSNIKTIPVAVGDLDGDGAPDLFSGSQVLGSSLPGGAVIPILASPGNPISGLTIKGGKNPGGGKIMSRTTNENGEFEFTDLEEGSYTFTVEQKLYIDDQTFISVGKSRAQDHNSTRSNKTASGIAPDPGSGGGSGGSKAQDHNSTRSNKTASRIATDPGSGGGGSGGNKSQDHNSSRSNKTNTGIAPDPGSGEKLVASKGDVKITASQNSQSLRTISVVADLDGDGVYETDVTSKVSDELILDKDGTINEPQMKTGISTSRSNIRNKYAAQVVTPTVITVQGSAIINGKEVPVQAVYKVVEKATSGLKDTLKTQVSIRPAGKYSPTV